jgi:hypothetical protein
MEYKAPEIFDAPEPDGFVDDGDAPFSRQIPDVTVTQNGRDSRAGQRG